MRKYFFTVAVITIFAIGFAASDESSSSSSSTSKEEKSQVEEKPYFLGTYEVRDKAGIVYHFILKENRQVDIIVNPDIEYGKHEKFTGQWYDQRDNGHQGEFQVCFSDHTRFPGILYPNGMYREFTAHCPNFSGGYIYADYEKQWKRDVGWRLEARKIGNDVDTGDYADNNSSDSYEDSSSFEDISDYPWLQGHWIYDVDISTNKHHRIHVVIEGNRIIQYRNDPSESTNPTFTIEDGKIYARYEQSLLTVYIIDPERQAISIDDGKRWMYKLGTDEEIRHRVGFESEDVFFTKIANQLFRSKDGNEIRFDENRKVYINGVYAGTLEIETLEKTKVIVEYSGGECEEGKLEISTDLMTRNFLAVTKIPFDNFYDQIRD